MEKSYTVAGISRLNGVYKVRVANSVGRSKVLTAAGHTDVDLVELPYAMTKKAAVDYLLFIDFDLGVPEIRHALMAAKEEKDVKGVKDPEVLQPAV
jgi:hypothetical protein